MNSYYVILGAIVILAGAVVHSAGVVAGAINGNINYGTGSMVFGSILMALGLFGPGLGRVIKWAYDAAPVDNQEKG